MEATIETGDPLGPVEVLDEEEIERELQLIDAAISMVRRAVARRVTLASLPLGREVLFAARARAGLYSLHVRTVDDSAGTGPIAVIIEAPER